MWGVILSTVGDTQYRGDIMMHLFSPDVGDFMSTVGGKFFCLIFEYPTILDTPTVLMISPTCIMISPTVFKFQRMVSPTVLNTPRYCTHIIQGVNAGETNSETTLLDQVPFYSKH